MPSEDDQPQQPSIYNRVFWLTYAANASLVVANALTFRFAELVAFLGGTEQIAGTIVSVGIIGALTARVFLGQSLDCFGTRKVWVVCSLLFVGSCVAFMASGSLNWLYVARIAFAASVAGMFTSSTVHIQNQVPAERRTEMIGNLGSSGFIGMIIGTHLGDLIFAQFSEGRAQFYALFGAAALLGGVYLVLIALATQGHQHRRPRVTPPLHKLAFRYWPGMIVLVAIMMGISMTVTTVFLTRFATAQNLTGIGPFFTGYCVSAFCFRVAAHNWSKTMGRHRMILLGLAGHCAGQCLLPFVTADWHFVLPSLLSGFGHALLFPAVVSMGSESFPRRYRGTGTSFVLGFIELGILISAPILGGIIDFCQARDFANPFTAMFWTSAATAVVISIVYSLTDGRTPDPAKVSHSRPVVGDECGTPEVATQKAL
ncbi:MAG: MFS transporter [Planctomycetaceae bacterium]|nr:MFS transporter [Planctomycetaceae bacterium]